MTFERHNAFHLTLARVDIDYPVDEVVQHILDDPEDWQFGELPCTEMYIMGP